MNRLAEIRRSRNLTQDQLAKKLNTSSVSVGRYEKEDSRLNLPLLRRLAEILDCSISEIAGGESDRTNGVVGIPEYDVRASAGGGFFVDEETRKTTWPFSRHYLQELRLSTSSLVIVEVQGDSMEPTLRSGDRVMIDTSDRNPAQPGIFCLWDSDRTVVKRVEKVPASDPVLLRLMSDNPMHSAYEVAAELVNVIGRLVWFARRM